MCTVSYVPLTSGYILTTNRDEDPKRETLLPRARTLKNGVQIMGPVDGREGGTWIAADTTGRTACIMNGALENHRRNPPYRMSRGQVVLQAFEAPDFDQYLRDADPEGLEPFTLLLIEPGRLQRWVWDGRHSHQFEPDPRSERLWSSATLYTREQHAHKEAYFREALEAQGISREALLKIHGWEGATPFVLDRPEVRTVSITQMLLEGERMDLTYYQLDTAETARITMPVSIG
ncbi:NRDE family protein [Robiginitalea sp. SC105]|uniref:NRDE family protein n=1 Tax=Robiginitalea sp. SC105 TaxID=2762332 RepID=UPI001639C8F8|nr:NRDE family protein [Robiginitalea sp. SC105]MBC2839317.1 NRDE family protein [Robiginitalea sp. SC105]